MSGTMDPSTWKPAETDMQLWLERSWMSGVLLGAVAYGVHATLFFTALTLLLQRNRTGKLKDWTWIAYICILFITSSMGNGAQMRALQVGFIDERNFPGGPGVWVARTTAFVGVFCNSVYVVNSWFQDGLLLYRFWIIMEGNKLLIALPALVYTTAIVLNTAVPAIGITIINILTHPGQTIHAQTAADLLTAYFTISVAFNVLLTVAIVTKLLIARKRLGKYLGDGLGTYVSVSAMLIESAALYSSIGIILVVVHGIKSPVQNLVLPTLSQVQSIAPLLIIMRVAQGRAWSAETGARVGAARTSSFAFSTGASETRINTNKNSSAYALSTLPGTGSMGFATKQTETEQYGDGSSGNEKIDV
ncbi:hypothetical protein EXIGLDRAFT_750135 [Exidia glandulosa HHB12029]|uniref:Uncharacterized protein n=1 Tax=Exidia glandulosa HHB12029 TaxID=1314781 RepID=A0A165H565_EXIGL|nr:hypothetical protein EXIGLDRAFT_750135 [Exidia glandulosa HHB12029]